MLTQNLSIDQLKIMRNISSEQTQRYVENNPDTFYSPVPVEMIESTLKQEKNKNKIQMMNKSCGKNTKSK